MSQSSCGDGSSRRLAVVFDWAGTLAISRSSFKGNEVEISAEKLSSFKQTYREEKRLATQNGISGVIVIEPLGTLDVSSIVTKALDVSNIRDTEARSFLLTKFNTKALAEGAQEFVQALASKG